MKIGYLFPGQGSQSVGMGKDLYDRFETYRNVYEKVKEITGVNVAEITFNSDDNVLNQTKNTQICILTMSLAILELLKEKNINAVVSSGLSLGEYSALIYSGKISFEDGVKIVYKRGELMQNFCPEGNWSMIAVLGLDEEKVIELCSTEENGFVAPANFNCPGQIVISGERNAICKFIERAKESGAKKIIELKTSGPFHTEKLKQASLELKKELNKIEIHKSSLKVIKNIDGIEYKEDDDVRDILSKHIISPVKFEKCIREMINLGVDCFVEVGPGKTLSSFVKKINRELQVCNINNIDSLNNTIESIDKIIK